MSETLILISGHLLIPSMAGVLFLLMYLYFRFTRETSSPSTVYFQLFLLSMGIYLLGRPVQVLSGPFPRPMIIADIRLFIKLAICFPCAYLAIANFGVNTPPTRVKTVFSIGVLMSFLFTLFQILGTEGHYIIGTINELTLYGTNAPAMKAPFYGCEITTLVHGFAAVSFIGLGIYTNIRQVCSTDRVVNFSPKFIFFYTGMALFALSVFVGCILRIWIVFYFSSLPSAIVIAWGMLLDIRERQDENKQVKGQLHSELLLNLHNIGYNPDHLTRILQTLGMSSTPDTVVVLGRSTGAFKNMAETLSKGRFIKLIERELCSKFSRGNYLVSHSGFMITALVHTADSNMETVIKVVEDIVGQLSIEDSELDFCAGIGSSHSNVKLLWRSWEEAQKAYNAAIDAECSVVHISDLVSTIDKTSYPITERTVLLDAIKLGQIDDILSALDQLISRIVSRPGLLTRDYRIILQDLSFLCKEAIASSSDEYGDAEEKHLRFCYELNEADSLAELSVLFRESIKEMSQLLALPKTKKALNVIANAQTYVESNISRLIKLEDVAQEVSLSSSYFKALFNKQVGMSFSQYLTYVRIREAKKLLHDPNLTISEVAYAVGFNDSNYFSTVFKKSENLSPSKYRKKLFLV